jgi:hypothetical protein
MVGGDGDNAMRRQLLNITKEGDTEKRGSLARRQKKRDPLQSEGGLVGSFG